MQISLNLNYCKEVPGVLSDDMATSSQNITKHESKYLFAVKALLAF